MIAAFNLMAVWIPQITAQIIDGAAGAVLDMHGILDAVPQDTGY